MSGRLDWDGAARRQRVREGAVDDPIVVWWWVPARRHSRCHSCGHRAELRSRVAYNRMEGALLCEACVEHRGLEPTPSRGWKLIEAQREVEEDGRE